MQGVAFASDDASRSVVRAAYATYIRDGVRLTAKNVAALEPYLDVGLYAMLARWAATPQPPQTFGMECTFDADPFTASQAGPALSPVAVGAATMLAGHTAVPVTLKIQDGTSSITGASRTLVELNGRDGHVRIFDIVPVIDGKPYPNASIRASLARFAKDRVCQR